MIGDHGSEFGPQPRGELIPICGHGGLDLIGQSCHPLIDRSVHDPGVFRAECLERRGDGRRCARIDARFGGLHLRRGGCVELGARLVHRPSEVCAHLVDRSAVLGAYLRLHIGNLRIDARIQTALELVGELGESSFEAA